MQCPTCKQFLDENVRFCPHDGTPLVDTGALRADSTPTRPHSAATAEGSNPQDTALGRPPTKEIELPVVVGNRYRLEELRGGGGMAKVYRATDLTLQREVAVKVINPGLRSETEFDTRFQREARIASQLADPHIVVVHDFGLDTALGPYLVMEYLQGQSLRERLASSGPLPLKAGLQLAGQLLLALMHAHGKGIVHRDIKPDNIFLLNQSGVRLHVRVLDFGIARIYRRDETAPGETLTHVGAVLGTPRYMSPEQLAGQAVDARSDLYSAALVIHEALTGQVPQYQGKRLGELCPDATPALQELIDQCLKPDPADRPPTAVEVYLRLQELGKASGILLLPPGAMDRLVAARKASEPTVSYTPPGQGPAGPRRRVWAGVAAGLFLALLAVGGLASYLMVPGDQTAQGPESLCGVKLGDTFEQASEHLALPRVFSGNPWEGKDTKGHLGHVLRPADLKLAAGELGRVRTHWTADSKVLVLFFGDKVIAVVSKDPRGRTMRGVRVGNETGPMYKHYPDGGQPEILPGKQSVEVRRYPDLGVGFEIEHARLTRITLYPPAGDRAAR
jgi:serine/threonine-protein kinase